MDRHAIGAELKRRNTSMSALSLAAGLTRSAISVSFRRPFERAERALITFLALPPHEIFPGRYDRHGNRTVRQGCRPYRPRMLNTSAGRRAAGQS